MKDDYGIETDGMVTGVDAEANVVRLPWTKHVLGLLGPRTC